MGKHSEPFQRFQPRGTAAAAASPPLAGLHHRDLSVLWLFPASALDLCVSPLPAGPVAAASPASTGSQRAFQLQPGCRPPPTRLGSARFTAGHHLQLLETRPALLTQEEPVPYVPALNGPLSPPWDAGPCCVPGDGEDLFSRDGFSGWGVCE